MNPTSLPVMEAVHPERPYSASVTLKLSQRLDTEPQSCSACPAVPDFLGYATYYEPTSQSSVPDCNRATLMLETSALFRCMSAFLYLSWKRMSYRFIQRKILHQLHSAPMLFQREQCSSIAWILNILHEVGQPQTVGAQSMAAVGIHSHLAKSTSLGGHHLFSN